jgi:16S rRNA (adenine1518-N6/adenine1519-N6)-dimethyltransferase
VATHGRRRALGQHFLRDQSIANSIAETALQEATKHSCQVLLEIGPGKGAITQPILDRLKGTPKIEEFLIVERDQKIAEHWKEHALYNTAPYQLRVEANDFLEVPESFWLQRTPLAVVSNLPYSVGTAIATRLAQHPSKIPVMVLMFQAEVAKRLRAQPSTKERGSLSIWIQNRWDVQKFLSVPPKAFSPPPDVDSEVVILTRRKQPWIDVGTDPQSEALWEKLLKVCFAHRRKMLRSVLPWQNALELSGVDGTKRAEALDWQEWDRLYQAVRKINQLSSL